MIILRHPNALILAPLYLILQLAAAPLTASILASSPVERYRTAGEVGAGIPVADNDGKAYLYDHGIGESAVLGPGTGNETVTWRFTSPTGNIYETVYSWNSSNECWIRSGSSACYASYQLYATGWIPLASGNWTLEDLGEWQFDLLLNGTTFYNEPWTLVSPILLKSSGDGQYGPGGAPLPAPLEVRLVEDDGITPIPKASVQFELTDYPRVGRNDTPPYLSKDGVSAGTTRKSTLTDTGGFARIYLHLGTADGVYTVTATSLKAPLDTIVFTATRGEAPSAGLDEEKNNGSPGPCENRVGTANAAGNPINVVTGNKFQSEQDFALAAPSRLEFTRYYNSKDSVAGMLGWNWRHSYSASISVVTSGKGKSATQTAYVKRADGKQFSFVKADTDWVSDLDVTLSLNQLGDGWEIKDGNVTETYDGEGRLTAIADVNGRLTQLSYGGSSGRLSRVSDDAGTYIDFFYNAAGGLEGVLDSALREWRFSYDASDNLTSVINPDLTTRQYHYEDARFPHALTGITDENAVRYATWSYDADGRANSSFHAGNADRVDIVYNTDGSRLVTNSRSESSTYTTAANQGTGMVTAIAGPGCSVCAAADSTLEYHPQTNKVVRATTRGISRTYGGYMGHDDPGYVIEAEGTPEERRTDYSYDPRFRNLAVLERRSSVNGFSSGYATVEKTYDPFGNLSRIVRNGYTKNNQPLVPRRTDHSYEGPLHQLSYIDGPRTDVDDTWLLDYYPNESTQGFNRARLRRLTGPGGLILADNIQYTATGQVNSEQRPNGLTLSYTYYPGNDRLEAVTESAGGTTRVNRWTYLPSGEVESVTLGAGSPAATTVSLEYDAARRLTGVRDGLGNVRRFVLDTEGNIESEETYDNAGLLTTSLARVYDAYNRLQQQFTENQFQQAFYDADGWVSDTIDGNNSSTTYTYDGLQRLATTTQLVGGVSRTISYSYDRNDQLASVRVPAGGTTYYEVTDFGEANKIISPDTGTTDYLYNEAGQAASRQDALGRLTSFQYDGLGRVLDRDADGAVDDRSYTYDTCPNGLGRLCAIENGYAAVDYAYDGFGNVTAHQGMAYEYDAAGRLSSMTYPSGTRVVYGFDAAGQVASVHSSGPVGAQFLATDIVYQPFGPVQRFVYGNGLPYSAQFDQAARLLNETVSTALSRSHPGYDGNGNLLNVTEQTGSAPSSSMQFSYYEDDALDLAQGPFGLRDYDYYASGNRSAWSDGEQLLPYDYSNISGTNHLNLVGLLPTRISGGGAQESGLYWCASAVQCWDPEREHTDYTLSMAYDSVGNTVSRTEKHHLCETLTYDDPTYGPQEYYSCSVTDQTDWTYQYSADNQLISVTANGTPVATYEYNPLGQRTRKLLADGTATRYVYGLDGALLVELNDLGNPLLEYIYLKGKLLAVNDLTTNSTRFVHTDHLGTPKVMTDQSGRIVWTASHDPFGAAMVDEDPDGDGIDVVMNVRFPGQYFDQETRLHCNYFRYYDPFTGRYISSDPIGLFGGLNTYLYVKSNAIKNIDPFGLGPFTGSSPTGLHWGVAVAEGIKNNLSDRSSADRGDAGSRVLTGFGLSGAGVWIADAAASGGYIAGGPLIPTLFSGFGGWEIGNGINEWYRAELGYTLSEWWANYFWEIFRSDIHSEISTCK